MDKKQRGRPRKAEGVKEHPLHIYFPTEEDVDLIKAAADYERQSISAWARAVLMREARRILGQQGIG